MSYKGSYTQQQAKSLALLSNVLHIGTNPVESLATYSDADWASYLDNGPRPTSACSSATTRCPGPPSAKPPSLAPCRSRVSWYCTHCHRVLFAPPTPIGAPRPDCYCDRCLLSQRQCSLHECQPSPSSPYQAYRDRHTLCSQGLLGQVGVLHIPSSHQFTDIMNKRFAYTVDHEFRSSLCVRNPPIGTAGRY